MWTKYLSSYVCSLWKISTTRWHTFSYTTTGDTPSVSDVFSSSKNNYDKYDFWCVKSGFIAWFACWNENLCQENYFVLWILWNVFIADQFLNDEKGLLNTLWLAYRAFIDVVQLNRTFLLHWWKEERSQSKSTSFRRKCFSCCVIY